MLKPKVKYITVRSCKDYRNEQLFNVERWVGNTRYQIGTNVLYPMAQLLIQSWKEKDQ